MHQLKICILGGTGFVGRALASQLTAAGHRVCILTAHRERNRDLLVNPCLNLMPADVYDAGELATRFRGMDAVVNLIGILNQSRGEDRTFQRVHVELPGTVADAVAGCGVPRLLHMSACGADPAGPSEYLQTKGRAEILLREHAAANPYELTIFRPSVIFGRADSFTNRFADLLLSIPAVFPLACPNSRLQPVYVQDVAKCFAGAIENKNTFGQQYDLCGPDVFTLYEIVDFIAHALEIKRKVLKLTDWQSKMQAAVLQWFPGKPFTPDNLASLQVDSVSDQPFPDVFGLTPHSLKDIAAGYLSRQPEKLDTLRQRLPH